jgi:hypothetical protein
MVEEFGRGAQCAHAGVLNGGWGQRTHIAGSLAKSDFSRILFFWHTYSERLDGINGTHGNIHGCRRVELLNGSSRKVFVVLCVMVG